ncbi:MAG: DUF4132 domain-containing protein, partial [Deferribacteraceae bacterium]|nr:DUF4132 domain-containing protein [Deferribacteraceae bacterium]
QDARHEGLSLFGSFIAYGKGEIAEPAGSIRDIVNDVYMKSPFMLLECLQRYDNTGIRDKFEALGMDIAPLFAFAAQASKNIYHLKNHMNDLYGKRYEVLKRALKYANANGKNVIYFYLNQNGQPVDIAAWEQVLTADKGSELFAHFVGSMLGQSAVAMRCAQELLAKDGEGAPLRVQDMLEVDNKKYVNDIISSLDNEKLLIALSTMRQYYSAENRPWDYILTAIAQRDPELYKKTFAALEGDPHVYLAMCLPKDFDVDFYIDLLGDKSKKVSNIAFAVLKDRAEPAELMADLKAKIAPLVDAKKKAVREYAEKLLMAYDGGSGDQELDLVAYYKKYGKSIEKALEWTNSQQWPKVRNSDEIGLKYYVYQFINSKTMELPPHVQTISKAFNKEDLHALAADIYSQWILAGAEAKKKGALLLFGVNATNSDVAALYKQITDWADSSRGAIAAEAVKAMALSGQDLALMQVDSIAAKFKNKQVKKAATESFALAASAMGLSSEQLADRIIPDLGFNQAGEKVIDYGTRKFTAFLTPALAVELKDEAGKAVKSLPKPGAKDDEAKASAAKAEFTALKKSLKTVVTTQASRLENALSSGRSWSIDAWERLFVKNPIMHSFAMGLIWGIYKNGTLTKTFRYMSDGSLSDENDDALSFSDYKEHLVGLVHPLELSEAQIAAWKEQLADYEIAQPFLQLERPTFALADDEKEAKFLERFGGVTLPGITLINKLIKMGWSKGSVQDSGAFSDSYKEFPESKLGVQLNHSWLYVSLGWDGNDDAVMGQVAFYKDDVARGSYVYDEPENFVPLCDVPAKLFSEVVYNLTEASKTSTVRNEKWKNSNEMNIFK